MEAEKENDKILIPEEAIEQFETDEKDEKILKKEKIKYILKGISSIISSMIHIFGFTSICTLGYTTVYLISFRRHFNNNLNHSYSYCYIPLINFAFSITAPLGGFFEQKFGAKKAIILSTSVLCFSFIIMYFTRSIYLDYILMCLNGFGIAIGANITKKNACAYFLNKKALICSIIYIFQNILSIILILFNEVFVLNYDIRYPSIEDRYYDESIFMNFQKVIIFEIGILISTCFISLLLYFQNDPKETLKFGFNEKIININKNAEIKVEKKQMIEKSLYNKRTLKLIIMILLFFPTINLITNSMRMDEQMYFIYGTLYNVVGCISCLIFGLLGDCVQFRILFVILSLLLSFTSYIYIKDFEGEFILFILTVLASFVSNGFNVIFDSHIMKVYGLKNFITMWGVIRASAGVSQIFGIIFNFALEKNSYIYEIIFAITGLFSLISACLGLFEKEDKFDYLK